MNEEEQTNKNSDVDLHFEPKPIPICKHHNKEEWIKGKYIDNNDGTISCPDCPWGCRLPGYMRVLHNNIVDLRNLNQD